MDISTLAIALNYTNKQIDKIKTEGFKIQVETNRSILNGTGEEKVLYFIPKTTSKPQDGYDEVIYVDQKWELIGSTDIDLSDYYTKSQIEEITGYFPLLFTQGAYINIGNGTSTIDLSNPVTNSSYRYSITVVDSQDCFVLDVTGGTDARAWAFLDENYNVISKANANIKAHDVIVAPANAAFLVVNDKSGKNSFCYKDARCSSTINSNSNNITIPTTKAVYDAIQTAIGGVENGSY